MDTGGRTLFPKDSRILVVDDSASARELMKVALKNLGCTRVEEASDGDEAVEIILKSSADAPLALVIADMKMPRLDGMQLLNFVRKSSPFPELPYFLCTADGDRSAVFEAIRAGANGYILKTVSYKGLEQRILQVWQSYQSRAA